MLSMDGARVKEEDEMIVKPLKALSAAVGRKALLQLLAFHLSLGQNEILVRACSRSSRCTLFQTVPSCRLSCSLALRGRLSGASSEPSHHPLP